MAEKSGVQAALQALGGGGEAAAAAEQLDLLGAGEVEAVDPGEAAGGRRGPGRPPGARNRRTQDWVDHLLGRYESPLVVLARLMTRDPDELARDLGCKRIEAIAMQVDAAKALAPYLHQRQPLAVNVDTRGVMQLQIVAPSAVAAILDAEAVTLDDADLQIVASSAGDAD